MSLALLRERAFVGGAWVDADGGARLPVCDPATGLILGHVPAVGEEETRRAVAAAAKAFAAWRERAAGERAAALRRWARAIDAAAEDLAALLSAEQGKPLTEARSEIAYATSFVDWFAEEARRVEGEIIPAPSADRRILVLRRPVGVVAAITPWNFPAAMVTRKVAPALAAGCTVVLKPSELTPFTALALAALAAEAGLPPGVLNVVTGPPEAIGSVLTGDPRVRKLTFTGSTEVGKRLAAQCAPTVKRVSLELGGDAALIVFDDADLDLAVEGAMAAKFRNAGQACVAANRILAQAGVHDAFVARLSTRVAALRIGPATADADLGPLIDVRSRRRVSALVDDAVAEGAVVVARAKPESPGETFHPALLLTGVTPEMRIAQGEIFGPVVAVTRFDTEGQGLAIANATPYGLAAYVFTTSLDRLFRVSEALEVGMVGFNTAQISSEMGPFGGVKESGYGREGSRHGLDDYLGLRQVVLAAAPPPGARSPS